MSNLLPCPFCGQEAGFNTVRYFDKAIAVQGWKQNTFHGVNCITCGVNNIGIRGYDTKEDAADAWNTRAFPQKEKQP